MVTLVSRTIYCILKLKGEIFMKKILTLIFTMLFTLSSLSIYAAQYTDISDFTDVTELATSFAAAGESVWYSAGSATDKTLSAEDGMLKSVVTGSITDNSGKYFRFANSKGRYTTDGEVLFSFDFMFEENSSGNIQPIVKGTYNPASDNDFFWLPGITLSGREAGKWYTIEYALDCETAICNSYITVDSKTVPFNLNHLVKNTDRELNGINTIELNPNVVGTVYIDNIKVATRDKLEITYPEVNAAIDAGFDLNLKGTMPAGYADGSAAVMIDGDVVVALEDNLDTLDINLPKSVLSTYAYGNHEISISADYGSFGVKTYTVPVCFTGNLSTASTEITYDAILDSSVSFAGKYSSTTMEQVTGKNGEENGALQYWCDTREAVIQHPVSYTNCTVIFEADIRRDDAAALQLECSAKPKGYVWLSSTADLISATGAIAGTTTKFGDGWHNIRVVADFANKTAAIYYDGAYVTTDSLKTSGVTLEEITGIGNTKIQIPSANMGKKISLDNVKFTKYIPAPVLESVSYTVDGASYFEAENNVISALSQNIKIALSANFDSAGVENIKINGVAVADAVADTEAKTVTLTPAQKLPIGGDVLVEFAPELTVGGLSMGKTLSVNLSTNNDCVDNIGEIVIDNDNLSANVTVDKAAESAYGDSVVFIIAAYTENNGVLSLKSVNFDVKPLVDGSNNLGISLGDANGGNIVKAFLWTDIAFAKPMK